jgi:hypothetical protein
MGLGVEGAVGEHVRHRLVVDERRELVPHGAFVLALKLVELGDQRLGLLDVRLRFDALHLQQVADATHRNPWGFLSSRLCSGSILR